MSIKGNMERIKGELPPGVKMVVVSKTRSPEEIMQVYSLGHKIIGENKVQELTGKKTVLPDDIEWHMVGHLQSNKVKYIAPFISLIHSVDSMKLLRTVSKEAGKNNRVIGCLLQVHIASEETKSGFSEEELYAVLNDLKQSPLPGIRIRGLMGMATFTDDMKMVRSEFRQLARIFKKVRDTFFGGNAYFCELSMGMSADYKIAIEEGSTFIRIGSLIFGEREY